MHRDSDARHVPRRQDARWNLRGHPVRPARQVTMESDEDRYIAEFVRGNRRAAGLRLVVVGAGVAAAGAYLFSYGTSLVEQQARSLIESTVPDRVWMTGVIALVIGGLLLLPGLFLLARSITTSVR